MVGSVCLASSTRGPSHENSGGVEPLWDTHIHTHKVSTRAHTCTHTHMHTCTHAHIHTYTHKLVLVARTPHSGWSASWSTARVVSLDTIHSHTRRTRRLLGRERFSELQICGKPKKNNACIRRKHTAHTTHTPHTYNGLPLPPRPRHRLDHLCQI